jgi:LacI family transcriptional regulator/LacI family repressor for deo operon, udp, cdd, tsx, nupC, and nupG
MAAPTIKNPTISDVARLAGVSKATVSAVLNNKSSIRESTRRTVVRAMEELAYRPSPSARRGFRPAQGKSIAFVVKESGNPYYAEVLAGIEEIAAERGYLVSVNSSAGDYERERRIVEQCTEREVDGLIITPIRHDDSDLSHIFELKRSNVPFVLLEKVPGIQASLVDVDNARGSWEAVKYLIEQGHARIAHLAGPQYSEHSRERVDGVRRAFSESQLIFDESMIVHAGDSLEDGYRAGFAYFRDHAERPTAVTCYNDLVAIGLLKALRELKIRVPEDVSVIGFDQLQLLDYFPLQLSTVSIPKHEMGKHAAELLIRQIEASRDLPAERVVLATELVLRESTRPPRKSA